MLLGKRPRPPMKRTTSMTEITLDLNVCLEAQPSDPQRQAVSQNPVSVGYGSGSNHQHQGGFDPRLLSMVSPRGNFRRHSVDIVETPLFLRSCSLCNRRLVPSRDIYMYRGDTAYCSSECRQEQMKEDERKDKCGLTASKKEVCVEASSSSARGETTVAAG